MGQHQGRAKKTQVTTTTWEQLTLTQDRFPVPNPFDAQTAAPTKSQPKTKIIIILGTVHRPKTPKPVPPTQVFDTRGVRPSPWQKKPSNLDTQSPPLQAVGNRPPPRRRTLREGRAAAKRSRRGPVPHPHNTDILNTPDRPLAGHTRRHLHRQREILARRETEPLESKTGHVLRDLGRLERRRLCPARGGVHRRRERTGTVLVDLPASVS